MVIEVRLKLLFAKRVVIRVTWTERIARSCCFEGCDRCSCRCWSRSNHDEIILKCQHLEQLPECPYVLTVLLEVHTTLPPSFLLPYRSWRCNGGRQR